MSAAELNFPPAPKGNPPWLQLAQAVFNRVASRWDPKTCGGGIRWQYHAVFTGHDRLYKNTVTNGGFMELASRLAHYTMNETYANWAEKTWDWLASTPIMEGSVDTGSIKVYDGAKVPNCDESTVNKAVYSYNPGTLIIGAANLYSYYNWTGNQENMSKWMGRMNALVQGTTLYYPTNPAKTGLAVNGAPSDVFVEVQCEFSDEGCGQDATSFKGFHLRWLTHVWLLTQNVQGSNADDEATRKALVARVQEVLIASAKGAAQQCSGGDSGEVCGQRWWESTWDGTTYVGSQMSAMSVFSNNLVRFVGPVANGGGGENDNGHGDPVAPLTTKTGGISKGNPAAGTGEDDTLVQPLAPITTGDKAGASILTILIISLTGVLAWFVAFSKDDMVSPHGLK
jgi:mannan endo-1,6-alpha-mannosidase